MTSMPSIYMFGLMILPFKAISSTMFELSIVRTCIYPFSISKHLVVSYLDFAYGCFTYCLFTYGGLLLLFISHIFPLEGCLPFTINDKSEF